MDRGCLSETDSCYKYIPFFENRSSRRREMKALSDEPSKNLREGKIHELILLFVVLALPAPDNDERMHCDEPSG